MRDFGTKFCLFLNWVLATNVHSLQRHKVLYKAHKCLTAGAWLQLIFTLLIYGTHANWTPPTHSFLYFVSHPPLFLELTPSHFLFWYPQVFIYFCSTTPVWCGILYGAVYYILYYKYTIYMTIYDIYYYITKLPPGQIWLAMNSGQGQGGLDAHYLSIDHSV